MKRLLVAALVLFPSFLHAAASTKSTQLHAMKTVLIELETHYGMIDFKREQLGVTLEDLEKKYGRLINQAKTLEEDLGYEKPVTRDTLSSDQFQQLMVAMIAELKDGHVNLHRLSHEYYTLGIYTAAIEGRLYVTGFSRDLFIQGRAAKELRIGDEIVAFNGEPVQKVAERLRLYSQDGTFEARNNEALSAVIARSRTAFPAVEEGATVALTFRRGDENFEGRYQWIETRAFRNERSMNPGNYDDTLLRASKESLPTPFGFSGMVKSYFRSGVDALKLPPGAEYDMGAILNSELSKSAEPSAKGEPNSSNKKDKITPVTRLTASVVRFEGRNIGVLRIPSYSPGSTAAAVNELRWIAEILSRFENAVDVLVVDQLSNSGGFVFYVGQLASLLAGGEPLRAPTVNVRLNETLMHNYGDPNAGPDYMTGRKPNWAQNHLSEIHYKKLEARFKSGEQWSGPLAMWQPDTGEAEVVNGVVMPNERVGFTRPTIILNDNKSASGGDFFPGVMQASDAAIIIGEASKGLGGPVYRGIDSMPGSEMSFRCTMGYCQRPDGLPLENLGVVPNILRPVRAEDLQDGFRAYSEDILRAAVMVVEQKPLDEIQAAFRRDMERTSIREEGRESVERIRELLETFARNPTFLKADEDLDVDLMPELQAEYAKLFVAIANLQKNLQPEEVRGLRIPIPMSLVAKDKFLGALWKREEFAERLDEMLRLPRWREDERIRGFLRFLSASLKSNPGQLWLADPCELLLSPK